MIHIFYLFGIVYLISELFAVLNPLSYTAKMERIFTFMKKHAGENLDSLPPDVKKNIGSIMFHGFFSLAVMIWAFIGLLTSQWIVFVAFLVFSVAIYSPISKLIRAKFGYGTTYTVYHMFGSLVDIGLIGFAIINHYHLHIDLMQLF